MKQLEQEKDSLLKGLEMVDQAREWYHRQVLGVEDKQKYIGHTSYNVSAHPKLYCSLIIPHATS